MHNRITDSLILYYNCYRKYDAGRKEGTNENAMLWSTQLKEKLPWEAMSTLSIANERNCRGAHLVTPLCSLVEPQVPGIHLSSDWLVYWTLSKVVSLCMSRNFSHSALIACLLFWFFVSFKLACATFKITPRIAMSTVFLNEPHESLGIIIGAVSAVPD